MSFFRIQQLRSKFSRFFFDQYKHILHFFHQRRSVILKIRDDSELLIGSGEQSIDQRRRTVQKSEGRS